MPGFEPSRTQVLIEGVTIDCKLSMKVMQQLVRLYATTWFLMGSATACTKIRAGKRPTAVVTGKK